MAYVIVIGLLILSGIFSGLTLGLLSLTRSQLERKIRLGDTRAKKIYSVRKNGNLLLTTLLVGNVAVNSAMAIFLGSIAAGFIAGLIATGLIVIFGEILPQAVFSRHAMKVGAGSVWLVRFFIILFYPVTKPISMALDKMLGEELPTVWSKMEISEIIRFHEDSPYSEIDKDEERILLGALSFSEKTAFDVMTPRSVVYGLKHTTVLDSEKLNEIRQHGFSRMPVFDDKRENILAVLFAKDLIGIDPDDGLKAIEPAHKDNILELNEHVHLDNLFNIFIKHKTHIAIIYDDIGIFKGIVTLEDIIEEILKIEIVDEADVYVDMQLLAKGRFKGRFIE